MHLERTFWINYIKTLRQTFLKYNKQLSWQQFFLTDVPYMIQFTMRNFEETKDKSQVKSTNTLEDRVKNEVST